MIMKETRLPREIHDLLKTGNIEELKRLFSECDPNAITIERFGSNIFSLSPMPKEFAVWAKEQGADIHFRDCYGQTPLFKIAKLDGDLSLLIELGADVNAARADGCTPLHVAAARGCKKTGNLQVSLRPGSPANRPQPSVRVRFFRSLSPAHFRKKSL